MQKALASHDTLGRQSVEQHGGDVVKMTGDGMCAAFADPLAAAQAAVATHCALAERGATGGVVLRVRSGVHVGRVERRNDDYFGDPVNRVARIMSAAHGGQILLSQAVRGVQDGPIPRCWKRCAITRMRDSAAVSRTSQACTRRTTIWTRRSPPRAKACRC